METLCGLFDKKRQWYYAKSVRAYTEGQRRQLLLSYTDYYRSMDSRLGGVKLHVLLTEELGRDLVRGRDSFL